jgi:DNA-binding protein HU-beta
MTKAQLVERIAKDTGIERGTVLKTVESFMETVRESMAAGENIYLRGFGNFILKQRAQKTARNISRNIMVVVPEQTIPAFKPAKEFKAQVKG